MTSPSELLPEGLVILPSGIAPEPTGEDSGHLSGSAHGTQGNPASGLASSPDETVAGSKYRVGPSGETSVPFTQPERDWGEPDAEEAWVDAPFLCSPDRESSSSSELVSSLPALRNDTGEAVWRLTPKAMAHQADRPGPLYRRVDEIVPSLGPSSGEREPVDISNSSGRT